MVYLPPHFTETDPAVLEAHIDRHDFGLLVTHGAQGSAPSLAVLLPRAIRSTCPAHGRGDGRRWFRARIDATVVLYWFAR